MKTMWSAFFGSALLAASLMTPVAAQQAPAPRPQDPYQRAPNQGMPPQGQPPASSQPAQAPGTAPQENPVQRMAEQREAMKALDWMNGVWRGPAWTVLPNGEKRAVTQTERIGPFLGGTIKVVEGRGYRETGEVGFNAFGIISYEPDRKAYHMRSYAQGRAGDFPITLRPDGYVWEIQAQNLLIRYTATFKDGTLTEVGDRIVQGREPLRFFEMNLKRVADTDWPTGTPVPAK